MFCRPSLHHVLLAVLLAGALLPLGLLAAWPTDTAPWPARPSWLALALAGGAACAGLGALLLVHATRRCVHALHEAAHLRAERVPPLPRWAPRELEDLQRQIMQLMRDAQAAVARSEAEISELSRRLEEATRNLAEAHEALDQCRLADGLTGLANRRALWNRLSQWERAAPDTYLPLQLILLRVENLETIQDQHGPQTADEVLAEVGQRLRRITRPQDFVLCYGGNEFLLLLQHCPAEAARERASAISRLLSRPVSVAGKPITVVLSTGSAELTARLTRPGFNALLQAAACMAGKGTSSN